MAAVKTTLGNHLYQFNNRLYRQLKGGPIGDNVTQLCARIVMRMFTLGYKDKLQKLGLLEGIDVLKLYVDDLNQVGYCLPIGTWYQEGKMYIPGRGWTGRSQNGCGLTQEELRMIQQEADKEANTFQSQEERERRSAALYRIIAN